jgi:hypothetical protein
MRNVSAVLPEPPDEEPLMPLEPVAPEAPVDPLLRIELPSVPVVPDEEVALRAEPLEPAAPQLLEPELRVADDEVNSVSEIRPSRSESSMLKLAWPLALEDPWVESRPALPDVEPDVEPRSEPLVEPEVERSGSLVEPGVGRSEPEREPWDPDEPLDCARAGTVSRDRTPAATRLDSLRELFMGEGEFG